MCCYTGGDVLHSHALHAGSPAGMQLPDSKRARYGDGGLSSAGRERAVADNPRFAERSRGRDSDDEHD